MARLNVGHFAVWNHLVIAVFIVFPLQVLAVDQQWSEDGTNEQWYEKGWSGPPSSIDRTDSVTRARRLRTRADRDGSGAGLISDLDDVASGIGEDDEDAELDGGSGADTSIEIGSGDINVPLPPTFHHSSAISTESPSFHSTDVSSTFSSTLRTTATDLYTIHVVPNYPPPTVTSSRKTTAIPSTSNTRADGVQERKRTSVRTSPTVPVSSSTVSTTVPPRKEKPPQLDDRNKTLPRSFWMRPGVLAEIAPHCDQRHVGEWPKGWIKFDCCEGLIGGAIAGLLTAMLLVMFVVYRMGKKDEGSYAIEEPKAPPNYAYAYQKAPTREYYA